MTPPLAAPPEDAFLSTFGILARAAVPEDGYWEYRFDGDSGISIDLSFNIHQASIQTTICGPTGIVAVFVQEAATRLWIDEQASSIEAEFRNRDGVSRMTLLTQPRPQVRWSTIATTQK